MGQNLQRTASFHKNDAVAINKESPHLEKLFTNNKKWVEEKVSVDEMYFKNMASGQQPKYLWIGCSDSRVPAEFITGCDPGEMFIHRNIANLVVNTDINLLSVLQFAVENIKVKDIIVCGHYECGGVAAAASNRDFGLLDHWLRNIRDVNRIYHDELAVIEDEKERNKRLVELNVIEQCINLYKNGIVQRHQEKYGYPRIHGLVYDISSGYLKQLDVDFKNYIDIYKNIYKLYPFKRDANPIAQISVVADVCKEHADEDGRISVDILQRKLTDCEEVVNQNDIRVVLSKVDIHEDGKVPVKQLVSVLSNHNEDVQEDPVK